MDLAFEQKIRHRAYEIWVAAGMVDGAADEHWLLAQNDVLAARAPAAAATPRKALAVTRAKSTEVVVNAVAEGPKVSGKKAAAVKKAAAAKKPAGSAASASRKTATPESRPSA